MSQSQSKFFPSVNGFPKETDELMTAFKNALASLEKDVQKGFLNKDRLLKMYVEKWGDFRELQNRFKHPDFIEKLRAQSQKARSLPEFLKTSHENQVLGVLLHAIAEGRCLEQLEKQEAQACLSFK